MSPSPAAYPLRFILFILFLVARFTVFAQNFDLGIKGGLGYSKIQIDDSFETIVYKTGSGKASLHAGLFIRLSNKWMYLQPEVLYTSSKGEIQADSIDLQRIISYQYNKIDLPVHLGLRCGKNLRLFGSVIGTKLLKMDAKYDIRSSFEDVLEDYNEIYFGYGFGIGLDYSAFVFDLSYEDNLSQFGHQVEYLKTDLRNHMFRFSVGIKVLEKKEKRR